MKLTIPEDVAVRIAAALYLDYGYVRMQSIGNQSVEVELVDCDANNIVMDYLFELQFRPVKA